MACDTRCFSTCSNFGSVPFFGSFNSRCTCSGMTTKPTILAAQRRRTCSRIFRKRLRARAVPSNVYSAQKIREKLDYIHTNPVKRRLVMHPRDWPWSSWGFYATEEQGVVRVEPTGEERQREESPPFAKTAKGRAPSLGRPR